MPFLVDHYECLIDVPVLWSQENSPSFFIIGEFELAFRTFIFLEVVGDIFGNELVSE